MDSTSTLGTVARALGYALLIVLIYLLSPGSGAVFIYQGF